MNPLKSGAFYPVLVDSRSVSNLNSYETALLLTRFSLFKTIFSERVDVGALNPLKGTASDNEATLSPATKPRDRISNTFYPNVRVLTFNVWAFLISASEIVWNEYLGTMTSDYGGVAVFDVAGSVAIVAEKDVGVYDWKERFSAVDNFWVVVAVLEAIWGLTFSHNISIIWTHV